MTRPGHTGGGQGFGGINPQDLPPGFRQFFFGPKAARAANETAAAD